MLNWKESKILSLNTYRSQNVPFFAITPKARISLSRKEFARNNEQGTHTDRITKKQNRNRQTQPATTVATAQQRKIGARKLAHKSPYKKKNTKPGNLSTWKSDPYQQTSKVSEPHTAPSVRFLLDQQRQLRCRRRGSPEGLSIAFLP